MHGWGLGVVAMTDPWDWYIYLHFLLIFMGHVGKYTSPMDPIRYGLDMV